MAVYYKKIRPLQPGCSIGAPAGETGTLTAFVRKPFEPGAIYLLCCEHVLSRPGREEVFDIAQPSNQDSGGFAQFDIVANNIETGGLATTGTNLVDAAIAQMDNRIRFRTVAMDERLSTDQWAPIEPVKRPVPVTMIGRTSGVSQGMVMSVNESISLPAENYPGSPEILYEGLGLANYQSASGDSGAPVFLTSSGELAGMHIGEFNKFAYFVPIERVLDELNVRLV